MSDNERLAAGSSASACSTEPCRRAYSREEMIEEAKTYMRETFGPCIASEDRDRWHERLGMLVDFVHDRFPSNAAGQTRAVASRPEPAGSAFNPDFAWYCPTCERDVQNEHVTFEETHDPRCGGCGNPVEPNAEAQRPAGAGTLPPLVGNSGKDV